MLEIKSYDEMLKLSLSQQYEYALHWQKQRENGAELEYFSLLMGWQADDQDISIGCLYRLKPQPTYAERQAKWIEENGIKVGSKVEITKRADSYQDGWENDWDELMDACIGKEYRIEKFKYESGIRLGVWDFPYFVLEPIPEPEIIDLDFSDYLDIVHKWLVDTRTGKKCFVNGLDYCGKILLIYDSNPKWISFPDLRKHCTYADGRRLEKEKVC